MPKKRQYEIRVRKGEYAGIFTPKGQEDPYIDNMATAYVLAKSIVDDGTFDEATVIECLEMKRFVRLSGI